MWNGTRRRWTGLPSFEDRVERMPQGARKCAEAAARCPRGQVVASPVSPKGSSSPIDGLPERAVDSGLRTTPRAVGHTKQRYTYHPLLDQPAATKTHSDRKKVRK